MSDNPFSGLLDDFRKGWQAGAVDYGSHKVRSRPSFWNPFHTWRDEEDQQLRALFKSVNSAFEASPFMHEDLLDKTIEKILVDTCTKADCTPVLGLLTTIEDTATNLIGEEFFSFPELNADYWNRIDLEEGVHLKKFLLRKQRFLCDPDHLFDIGCRKLTIIYASLLNLLPDNLIHDNSDEKEAGALSFDVNLIDVIEEPKKAIEGTISTLFDKDIVDPEIFHDVREQLEHNVLVVSGINPKERTDTRPIVLPTKVKDKTTRAIVDAYLKHTPFHDFFSSSLPFVVPFSARFEHTHILGGTGHGKTQLMQQLIYNDLLQARDSKTSVVIIDSQGDLIRTISHLVEFGSDYEKSLADKFVLIDPNDVEHPISLNMFDVNLERIEGYSPVEREKILNGTIELYEYIFGALLGAELTQKQGVIFRYLARLMLVIPDATIQTLRELMEDGKPFRLYMTKLQGTARKFFETEFFSPSFNATKKQILRRLWGVLSNTTFERIFSHPRNKVDIFESMNEGKIILINTAKDLLKQEGCEIFGRFFIAMIAQAALQRAAISEGERTPTFVYVDEAHDYFDDNIEQLLNQARKYRVGLTLAHQNLDQLSTRLRASIMASTSIKLAGGVSNKDARLLAADMRCDPDFVQDMRKRKGRTEFACFVKNETTQALKISVPLGSVNALPTVSEDDFSDLISENRQRYCSSLEETEQRINESHSVPVEEAPTEAASVQPKTTTRKPTQEEQQPAEPPINTTKETLEKEKRSSRPADPYLTGQGGKEHTYLQQLIKHAAQDRGYMAVVERQVLSGAGSVDVSLEKDGRRIACEISVTTTPEHELGNVQKCLKAGYDEVVLISSNVRKLGKLKKYIEPQLSDEGPQNVQFLLPEQFIAYLDTLATEEAASSSTVRGYKVKVRHKAVDPEDAQRRREAIAGVIAKSIRQHKK